MSELAYNAYFIIFILQKISLGWLSECHKNEKELNLSVFDLKSVVEADYQEVLLWVPHAYVSLPWDMLKECVSIVMCFWKVCQIKLFSS